MYYAKNILVSAIVLTFSLALGMEQSVQQPSRTIMAPREHSIPMLFVLHKVYNFNNPNGYRHVPEPSDVSGANGILTGEFINNEDCVVADASGGLHVVGREKEKAVRLGGFTNLWTESAVLTRNAREPQPVAFASPGEAGISILKLNKGGTGICGFLKDGAKGFNAIAGQDNNLFAAAGNEVSLWDVEAQQKKYGWTCSDSATFNALRTMGTLVLAANDEGQVMIFDSEEEREVANFTAPAKPWPVAVTLSNGCRYVAFGGIGTGASYVFDVGTRKLLHVLGGDENKTGAGAIALEFSADARQLISGAINRSKSTICRWDIATGEKIGSQTIPLLNVCRIIISPELDFCLAGNGDESCVIDLEK